MTRRSLVVTAAVFAVLAAGPAAGLVACSSRGPDSSGVSTGASEDPQLALETIRRFAQCAREHGYPNFPDPALDGNEVVFPNEEGPAIKEQIRTILEQVPECKAIMDSFQGSDHGNATPPSAADMAKLREFAKCIREHGIPEFPDPKADGSFPLTGTPLQNEGKSERVIAAMDACKDIYDKKIAVS